MDLKGHSYSGAGSAAYPVRLVAGPALLLLPSVGLRVWPPAARPGCCAVVLVSGDAGILLEAGPSVDGLAQAILGIISVFRFTSRTSCANSVFVGSSCRKGFSNFIAAQSSATLNYILVERGSGAGVDPRPQNRASQEQPK